MTGNRILTNNSGLGRGFGSGIARCGIRWSVVKSMTAKTKDIRMLAIDLDGTLLGRGDIDRRDLAAVHAARAAGIEVVVATGRSWVESRIALDQLDLDGVMIGASGAIAHDVRTGRTVGRTVVDSTVITTATASLIEHGFRVNLLQDSSAAGFDYWMVGTAEVHEATSWWFERNGINARWANDLSEIDGLDHTLRVGAVATGKRLEPVTTHLREKLADRALIQHWKAVVENEPDASDDAVHLFEGFHPTVDKWTMIEQLLDERGLQARHVMAIGDGLNDIGMLKNAGLGIAMANADADIRAVADETTGSLGGGVADAIDRILASR